MYHRSWFIPLLGAIVAATTLTGCSFSQLEFVQDHQLHINSPRSGALVAMPVTLSWTMSDFTVAAAKSGPPSSHAGYFAIFMDRAPVGPGQSLSVLADPMCRRTPGCFNAQYLGGLGVYTSHTLSFTVKVIAAVNTYQKVQLHEATIVLMNTAGRRIGESEWYVDFRLRDQSA
jgi:hypothetical protein